MIAVLADIRCLFLFIALAQTVSLYKIYPLEDEHFDLSSSSFNEKLDEVLQNIPHDYEDMLMNAIEHGNIDDAPELKHKSKRAISTSGTIPLLQQRNSRPHWNPLIAAYKRCGELGSSESRENCFKDAVQMLFVHKLRK
ncbi:unnamed protein product [Rotaria socialis]|uniref:Uncharacterized protein n=1 Tax=Rotaria socialis TaxID=392032 RepID=A0A820WYZ6_9BILA|nr:unnamed protein product [Rotaria socialis]CAF3402556.1 unnamed protein product [Rotaria socialis]CAF3450235.1 unnamed protein product [Rotaria socialis]CAF3560706.1 unnamed protein product [Rotaria socialis]CAF3643266.1 unnamed protein product [Rotaria socialis]